jgi:hypothetical protein
MIVRHVDEQLKRAARWGAAVEEGLTLRETVSQLAGIRSLMPAPALAYVAT